MQRFLDGVVLYSDGVTLPKSHKRLRGGDLVTIGRTAGASSSAKAIRRSTSRSTAPSGKS